MTSKGTDERPPRGPNRARAGGRSEVEIGAGKAGADGECRTRDQGSRSLGKGPFAHETSVWPDKFHLRLRGDSRQI